jgi:hypothetical protein
VIAANPSLFTAEVLTAQNNDTLLIEQALQFNPNVVVIGDEKKYLTVKEALSKTDIKVFAGEQALVEVAALDCYDMMLAAIVGYAGLKPTLKAISCGKPIALANKETLVVAGDIAVYKSGPARPTGGAGIVAAHAAGLGAGVNFISVIGDDECGEYAKQELLKFGVEAHLMVDDSRPTTLKQRYRSKGKSLLRVSKLHQGPISLEIQKRIIDNLEKIITNVDLVIFSDFNYGCLPQDMLDKIISLKLQNYALFAGFGNKCAKRKISHFQFLFNAKQV